MDGIILLIVLLIVCFYFRDFGKIVYAIAIIDIFLRIFYYVINNVEINGISSYIEEHLKESVPDIICSYTSGLFCNILVWIYVIIMGIFYTTFFFFKINFVDKNICL